MYKFIFTLVLGMHTSYILEIKDCEEMYKTKSKLPASVIVYEKIKANILNNELKPGIKLVESNLAQNLNVSRTPVREALRQLEQDGLITYEPQKGSTVSDISIKNAHELYEVREVLEGLAIRLLCINLSNENMNRLKDIVLMMDESVVENNYSEHILLHKKWTEMIVELTENSILKNDLISLNENLSRLRKISLSNVQQNLDAYVETKSIFKAIENKDPDESEKLARMHVKKAKERFNQNIINKLEYSPQQVKLQ